MVMKISRLMPLALAMTALAAHADGDPSFSFSGFATLGAVSTNTDNAQYVISGQPHGATHDNPSGEVDSKVGLQGTGKLNDMFSATVQVLSKQDGDGSYRPEFEWAFAKAQLLPSLSVRVGRIGDPLFAVSDFRDVGYANLWLRPPQDVYGQVPISNINGGDVIYQMPIGTTTLTAQIFGGDSKAQVEHTTVEFKNQIGINLTAELDDGLTFRVGHVQGKLTVDSATLTQLVGILETTPFASVGQQLDPTSKDASFTGVGIAYDQGNIVGSVEYTWRRTDSYVPNTTGWFATAGYRFGKLTPYLTVSQLKEDSNNVNNNIPTGVNATLNTLYATVNGVLASQYRSQKTVALGARWDFYRSMDLKAQIENIKPTGPGLFVDPTANFGQGGQVNVYSVAVDMVF